MKGVLAGTILFWIFAIMFFPEDVGEISHRAFIGMKTGWEKVNP